MKFLIVGASGFIGSHLFRDAKAAGHDVVGTRSQSPGVGLLQFDLRADRIHDCVTDDFLNGSHVVICSSICQIDRCYRERDISRLVNVERTIQLIDDVASLANRVVFLSTSHVFDGETGYYCEEHTTNPLSEYGRQKLAVEQHLLDNIANALVLRLDKIIGDCPDELHLLTEWWELIQKGQPIRCIEAQTLSPTLVTDVVKAILVCCEQARRGLYHVSAPEFFERAELAQQFVLAAGSSTEVVSAPVDSFGFADRRPLRSHLYAGKLAEQTGLRFTTMQRTMSQFLARRH